MEKINFEDATLKKSAYVTINGTEYPVTDAEYIGGTDLDAATLNYAFKLMHPVGSIYMTTVETNPSEIFGFGTWELWGAGRVPVGVDTTQTEFNTVEKTSGEKTHKLTINELPKITGNARTNIWGNNDSIFSDGVFSGRLQQYIYSRTSDTSGENDRYAALNMNFGNDEPHNNLQPYITCYMFKRTA